MAAAAGEPDDFQQRELQLLGMSVLPSEASTGVVAAWPARRAPHPNRSRSLDHLLPSLVSSLGVRPEKAHALAAKGLLSAAQCRQAQCRDAEMLRNHPEAYSSATTSTVCHHLSTTKGGSGFCTEK